LFQPHRASFAAIATAVAKSNPPGFDRPTRLNRARFNLVAFRSTV
jgi:hypothetical protein